VADRTGAVPVPADLADLAAIGPAVARAVSALGGMDALVNAAGVFRAGTLLQGEPRAWQEMAAVNVVGLMAVTHHCLPHLLRRRGSTVVNVSSTAARRAGTPGTGAYAATKAAVNAVSASLRDELVGRGLRVTTVMPGFVATTLFDHGARDPTTRHLQRVASDVGLDPAVVARAIADVIALPPDREVPELVLVPTQRAEGPHPT
jgi:NADP-dependent 3-hydroxy acid dehydrogenase YdfG